MDQVCYLEAFVLKLGLEMDSSCIVFIYFVISILKLGFKINDNIPCCMYFETWCKNESNLLFFCYRESLLRQEA
jgi:hypothetical protein